MTAAIQYRICVYLAGFTSVYFLVRTVVVALMPLQTTL